MGSAHVKGLTLGTSVSAKLVGEVGYGKWCRQGKGMGVWVMVTFVTG